MFYEKNTKQIFIVIVSSIPFKKFNNKSIMLGKSLEKLLENFKKNENLKTICENFLCKTDSKNKALAAALLVFEDKDFTLNSQTPQVSQSFWGTIFWDTKCGKCFDKCFANFMYYLGNCCGCRDKIDKCLALDTDEEMVDNPDENPSKV